MSNPASTRHPSPPTRVYRRTQPIYTANTHLIDLGLHHFVARTIRARGAPAADRESAQTVFAVDAGLTPFDLERITAEFM